MSECEEIANTINRLVEAGHIAKAQELLELSLDDYFVLQLAVFANKKVNAYTTIAAWKQAGLRLPPEDTDEFDPYRNSPAVTEEELKVVVDKMKERTGSNKMTLLRRVRWLGVLPVAFLAGNLVFLATKFVFFLIYNNTGDWLSLASTKHFELLTNLFLVPFTFVYVGAYVAPSRKFATRILLSILCLIGMTVLLIVAASDPSIHMSFFAIYAPLIYMAGILCGLLNALRWIAILPAAILAAVVAQLLAVIGGIFVPDWIAQASSSWIVPGAFVIGGVYTAPKLKFVVALVLTLLVVSLEVLMGFLVLTDALRPPSGISKWWFIVNAVIGIAAPIYICASLHNDPDSWLSDTDRI